MLLNAVEKVVDKYVDVSFGSEKQSKKHEKQDYVLNYASDLLTMGLLVMEFEDAIHEADGFRILRCWRHLLLIYRATNRRNYSLEAFRLIAQYDLLLSPHMAQQLIWSRTVNIHSRPGRNIPADLHMEHLNRMCKSSLGGLGPNLSAKSVDRVGKSIGELSKVTDQYDRSLYQVWKAHYPITRRTWNKSLNFC